MPEGTRIVELLCDPARSWILYTTTADDVHLLDLESLRPLARLRVPCSEGNTMLSLSDEGRTCFVRRDTSTHDPETRERLTVGCVITCFDIGSVERP